MPTTLPPMACHAHGMAGSATFSLRIGAAACSVRAFPVATIHELLGFDRDLEAAAGADEDPGFVADAIESRMIMPPRPRRRRERAVSSRAVFFGG